MMADLLDEIPSLSEIEREETQPAAAPRRRRPPDLVVVLPGAPRGKGRPRTRVIPGKEGKPGFAHVYTDSETRNYEAMLRYQAQEAMGKDTPLFEGPLRVRVNAIFPIPQSWSNKKRQDALRGVVRPTGKPDGDNLLKCIDALNGIVWRDDGQIVDARVVKAYGDKPTFEVEVWKRHGVEL